MQGLSGPALCAFLALLAVQALFSWRVWAQSADSIPSLEADLIAEAYQWVDRVGDEVWPGLSEVPFPVLLISGEREYLTGWDQEPPQGMDSLGKHPRLGRQVWSRPRQFDPGLKASFPAFGPPAVVVMGTVAATELSPAEWLLTLLHEHFHQLQYAAPGYYAESAALGLADADPSGMWMLNYPFPYETPEIGEGFDELARLAHRALVSQPGEAGERAGQEVWAALAALLDRIERSGPSGPADARYLSFQLWQEGIARHVEWRAAEVLASWSEADAKVTSPTSPDPASSDRIGRENWTEIARVQAQRTLGELESASLAENGRVSFYALGAALGVLLDREGSDWQSQYLDRKFALEAYHRGDE